MSSLVILFVIIQAFVRQLPKVELVIDYDQECKAQLTRFGFMVIVYPLLSKKQGENGDSNNYNNCSSLGKHLLL